MFIEKLYLKNFGQFQDLAVDFNENNLSTIIGPNESGKSTLLNAIYAFLFGLQRHKNHYVPWNDASFFQGEIIFRDNGQRFALQRDFKTNQVSVRCLDDSRTLFELRAKPRGRSVEYTRYLDWVTALLGGLDDDLFANTAFVFQKELVSLNNDDVTEKMKLQMSGSQETDYQRVRGNLEKSYDQVTQYWPDGSRKNKARDLELKKQALEALDQKILVAKATRQEEQLCQENIRILSQELGQLKGYYAEVEQRAAALAAYNTLQGRARELEKNARLFVQNRETLVNSKQIIEDAEKELSYLHETIRQLPATFAETLVNWRYLRDEKEKEVKSEKTIMEETETIQGTKRMIRGVSLVVLLLAVGFFWFFSRNWTFTLSAAVVLSASFYLSILVVDDTRKQRPQRIIALKKAQEKIEELENREKHLLQGHGLTGEDRFDGIRDQFSKRQALEEKITLAKEHLSVVPEEAEQAYQDILAELDTANVSIDTLTEANPELKEVFQEGMEEAQSAEKLFAEERDNLAGQIDHHKTMIRDNQLALASLAKDGPSVTEMDRERDDFQADINRLERKRDILALAIENFTEAVKSYHERYLDRLEETINTYFRQLTEGKYEVHLDQETLIPHFQTRAQSAIYSKSIPLAVLSTGTRDQFYFAMRLGLLDIITAGKKLPLILDDPFVDFDEQRLRQAWDILRKVAGDRQVILASHDHRYQDMAVPVLNFYES